MGSTSESRPDPDALLAAVQADGQSRAGGRLRVYLGMAAGVGKTYGMLADAHEHKKRGVDVVVGYLESHGRIETESLADGLEVLPLRQIEHRGVTLKEFDLDAALERRPQLLLLDELAHSNAPGSRHAKRYQDVLDLLDAGIDVCTTMNVQHLESLNDVVAQISGVVVREKVPDSILDQADEIELIDVPPEELIQRLREGKVYVPEKVEQALEGFFRKANLSALRELALRQTAQRVDVQMQTYRAAAGAHEPWAATTRILVCVAPNQLASRVVRAACNLAASLHAQVLAVTVEGSRAGQASQAGRDFAAEAMDLAERLGAETTTLVGMDVVGEVLRLARSRNVTLVVAGKPIRARWREILFGSVVDDLVRRSGEIDVHIITGSEESGAVPSPAPRRLPLIRPAALAEVLATCTVATAICWGMSGRFDLANLVMVYLIGVVWISGRHSLLESALASVLSVAAFDFFFVMPTFTFSVTDLQYLITFAIMLGVGLLIGSLTSRLRSEVDASSQRERRTSALYDLSRRIAGSRSRSEIGKYAVDRIEDLLASEAMVWRLDRKGESLLPCPGSESGFENAPTEQGVAFWALRRGKQAGLGTDTLPGAVALYLPLTGANGIIGVLAARPKDGIPFERSQVHLLDTIANQVALALERTNLARESNDSRIAAETERARSTLLSSVSHDLRTPLAVIAGSASRLAEPGGLPEETRKELATSIVDEAERLNRLVRNLLDMTRLDSPTLELQRDWHSVEELVGSAVARTEALFAGRALAVQVEPGLPLVKLDGVLFEQVLVNLLENAARHTGAGTPVDIQAARDQEGISLVVADRGPGVPVGEEDAIFGRFQRRTASEGVGLGLAICRTIVDVHGGTIQVQARPGGGALFKVWLPPDLVGGTT